MLSNKSFLLLCNAIIKSKNVAASCRLYSQWAPYYLEPVFDKNGLSELKKTGELEKLKSTPIKATRSEFTCSVFFDPELDKFSKYVMRMGKKALARELIDKTFEKIKRIQLEKYYSTTDEVERSKMLLDPKEIFHKAISNCMPILHLTPVIRGGSKYQVPVPCSDKRSRFLAMNWIIEACKDVSKTTFFHDALTTELLDAASGTGKIVKKKIDLHRQCEANRAYAHYRWG